MIAEAWLPDTALHDDAIAHALRARAQDWAARWFVESKAVSVRAAGLVAGTRLPKSYECWCASEGPELLVSIEAQGLTKLAALMLGIPLGWPKLTPADAEIVDALASRAIEDLFAALMDLVQLRADARRSSEPRVDWALRYTISVGQGAFSFDVYAPRRVAIAARKAVAQSGEAVSVSPREAGLLPQAIDVGLMLGTGMVSLSELHSLAQGDVLVLDRGPDDPVRLAIDGRARDVHCALARDGARLKLQIQPHHAAEAS